MSDSFESVKHEVHGLRTAIAQFAVLREAADIAEPFAQACGAFDNVSRACASRIRADVVALVARSEGYLWWKAFDLLRYNVDVRLSDSALEEIESDDENKMRARVLTVDGRRVRGTVRAILNLRSEYDWRASSPGDFDHDHPSKLRRSARGAVDAIDKVLGQMFGDGATVFLKEILPLADKHTALREPKKEASAS